MTEKTNIDDIIGIVKTEEKTDSVELKKEYYKSRMTENKRYSEQNLENHLNRIYDNHEGKVIFDDEIIDLLNEQEDKICALNKRLSESLPLWVFDKVINRRIESTDNEDVKKELGELLVELK